MEEKRILTAEVAKMLGTSPRFVRRAMQLGKLPIGIAIKTSSKWTYHISAKLLEEYTGEDVEKELAIIREENQKRVGIRHVI